MSEWADMLAETIDTHRDDAVTIVIERSHGDAALPWSCDITCGEGGFGLGETLEECVEAAIHDFQERRR